MRRLESQTSDEVTEELWRIKDSIAREHANDVRRLEAYLQDGKRWGDPSRSPGRSVGDMLDVSPGQLLSKTCSIPT